MTGLIQYFGALIREILTGRGDRPKQLRWGIAGVTVCAVALLAAGTLYVIPFGQRTYVADFKISGGAHPGDEVRVAGINVGKVRSVDLVGDHVEIAFTVNRDVHVGDRSAVEIKMLTPIGGHYLALSPAGDKALGEGHIPPERTTTPFELSDILDRGTPVFGQVDGTTLRDTFGELNSALAGQPDALRNVIGNANELTGLLSQRTQQLDTALQVSDEYIAAVATDKAMLTDFVRQLGAVADQLGNRKDDIISVFNLVKRLLLVLHRPIMAYGDNVEPTVTQFEQLFSKAFEDPSRIDTVINGLRDVITKLNGLVGTDVQVADPAAGVQLCIPYEGKAC
ncbi:MlaD family protein [Nocardia huaxiensis]|uniref:MCE family protein n=1 Tax=Nocardia huaxiensis TaxID=2755382 RepID=A0A7D6V515_9NOCA|nr:MCE family protein [Nocardia huaxiensis]QLY27681.1 MCE family protein [Nocardia huaxiensis]UFS98930.1 MCE family protein [Nocardia huaxiensis]